MKALARRPADRYTTAIELAEDVRRWLADEPVSAWREPAAARLGPVGPTAPLGRHRGGRRFSWAGSQRWVSASCWWAASGRVPKPTFGWRDEADRIYYRILGDPLLDRPGMDPFRREIIRAVQEYYRKLTVARPGDPELAEHLGWSYLRLARVTLQLGEADRAVDQARLGLDTFERLARDHPRTDRYRSQVAHAELELGEIYHQSSRLLEAESAFTAALAIWEDLYKSHDGRAYAFELATVSDELGSVYLSLGRTDHAFERHRTALAIWEELARQDEARDTRSTS